MKKIEILKIQRKTSQLLSLKTWMVTIILLSYLSGNGQDPDYPFPPLSPEGKVEQVVGYTKITVEYERPSARGRTVFGEVVPWGIVWRTGAGYCTKISFDKDVEIEGKQVKAGKYSLFTIPTPSEWTIILNTDTTLYGSYWRKEENDIFRSKTIPQQSSRYYEALTIDIELIPNNARIYISWADTQISFDVVTSTDAETMKLIEEQLITRKSTISDHYLGAAGYLMYQNGDLELAVELSKVAVEMDSTSEGALYQLIQLQEKTEKYQDALETVKVYQELVKKKDYPTKEEKIELLQTLETDYNRIQNKMQ